MACKDLACSFCCSSKLELIPEFSLLPRVTSDCVPFRSGGKLFVCGACGGVQALGDERWLAEIGEIYRNYDIYHQSGGAEQHVVDPRSGKLRPRSSVLLERLAELPGMPRAGKVLDIGCGTGGTLRAFSESGAWALSGLEMDDRNAQTLSSIANFETLYTCAVSEVPQHFNIVTMVHSLEHFPEPLQVLREVCRKVAPAGRVFVQVPDVAANPFGYLVADHMSHFTAGTLTILAERAGLSIECLARDWVTKELSMVAKPGGVRVARSSQAEVQKAVLRIRSHAQWLHGVADAALAAAAESASLGLFGASIAATWLHGLLGDRVAFFVEEDPHRLGRTHLGLPILAPWQAPPGSVIFLPLIPEIADKIHDRLASQIEMRLPPRLDSLSA